MAASDVKNDTFNMYNLSLLTVRQVMYYGNVSPGVHFMVNKYGVGNQHISPTIIPVGFFTFVRHLRPSIYKSTFASFKQIIALVRSKTEQLKEKERNLSVSVFTYHSKSLSNQKCYFQIKKKKKRRIR